MEKLIHRASGELEVEDPFSRPGRVDHHGTIWYITEETIERTVVLRSMNQHWKEEKGIYITIDPNYKEQHQFGLVYERNLKTVDS